MVDLALSKYVYPVTDIVIMALWFSVYRRSYIHFIQHANIQIQNVAILTPDRACFSAYCRVRDTIVTNNEAKVKDPI